MPLGGFRSAQDDRFGIVLRERAYGKLNLTLDILGKRADGYHDLEMVMCSVSLFDELTLELGTGGPWSVTCDQDDLPQNEGNLCWKAARLYFDAAGIDPEGLTIRVRKAIPAQAGMAGGSSDAAAVLRALNRHYGCFSEEQLRKIGLRAGSDVPYCLFGGVALARGRGERLTRLPDLPEGLCFVLAKPAFSVSTPALFREIDAACPLDGCGDGQSPSSEKQCLSLQASPARPDTPAMLRALAAGDAAEIGAQLANAFEPLVAVRYPIVGRLRAAMLDRGALGARLTGTGSVVFGLFAAPAAAESAAAALRPHVPEVYLVRAIGNRQ